MNSTRGGGRVWGSAHGRTATRNLSAACIAGPDRAPRLWIAPRGPEAGIAGRRTLPSRATGTRSWMPPARHGVPIACIRFRLHAMRASVHAPDAASPPRIENHRNPKVFLMFPHRVTFRQAKTASPGGSSSSPALPARASGSSPSARNCSPSFKHTREIVRRKPVLDRRRKQVQRIQVDRSKPVRHPLLHLALSRRLANPSPVLASPTVT